MKRKNRYAALLLAAVTMAALVVSGVQAESAETEIEAAEAEAAVQETEVSEALSSAREASEETETKPDEAETTEGELEIQTGEEIEEPQTPEESLSIKPETAGAEKETPTITALPQATTITYGQTLSDSQLLGGAASTAGTFVWKDGNLAPAVADSDMTEYGVVFLPEDIDAYETVEFTLILTVNKADAVVVIPPAPATPDAD